MAHPKKDTHRPPEDALWFLSLGGSGEIGMNLNLYGTSGKWLMVDCGIMFPDETMPGIEVITPDISFIAERRNDLLGLVVTHGHEDHLGAIEHLWADLRCPIYAAPFVAAMIRAKLEQAGMQGQVKVVEVPLGGSFELGPFAVEMVPVTHSIPESSMLAIKTQYGTVLHTGDWKFDPDPVVGRLTDEERLKELGKEGIAAMVCDSTGALVGEPTASEKEVQDSFQSLFGKFKNRIVVTCFASNIARLKSVAMAARANGRYVSLVGRSLWRNAEIAESLGYLPEYADFLSEHEAMQAPRDKIVMVCTGCQGEARAALSRIAVFDHPAVELDRGDAVIYSSREIPGNEKPISRVQNLLIKQGLDVVTNAHAFVHASGHAGQPDIKKLYEWIHPALSVPVHGELRHQTEHARLAHDCGVPDVIIPANGEIVRLGPGLHEIVAEVPAGRWGLDGKLLRALGGETLKLRRKMNYNGIAVVTLVLDRQGMLVTDPQVSLLGVDDAKEQVATSERLIDVILDEVDRMPRSTLLNDQALEGTIVRIAKRALHETYGKKPMVEVHLARV